MNIKSIHIIEYKYKTKYKKFAAINYATCATYITFKGVKIEDDEENNLEEIVNKIKTATENGEVTERHIPWSSVVEIKIKRYKQE